MQITLNEDQSVADLDLWIERSKDKLHKSTYALVYLDEEKNGGVTRTVRIGRFVGDELRETFVHQSTHEFGGGRKCSSVSRTSSQIKHWKLYDPARVAELDAEKGEAAEKDRKEKAAVRLQEAIEAGCFEYPRILTLDVSDEGVRMGYAMGPGQPTRTFAIKKDEVEWGLITPLLFVLYMRMSDLMGLSGSGGDALVRIEFAEDGQEFVCTFKDGRKYESATKGPWIFDGLPAQRTLRGLTTIGEYRRLLQVSRFAIEFDGSFSVDPHGEVTITKASKEFEQFAEGRGVDRKIPGDIARHFPKTPGRYSGHIRLDVEERPTGTGMLDGILKTNAGDDMIEYEANLIFTCGLHTRR